MEGGQVQRENLPRTLRLTGAVAYNAFQTSPVFSPIGGPVHEILATPGQIVSRGQPLLLVTSPDYSVARSAYIKARDTYELSDKLFNRAKDLYAHGAIAESFRFSSRRESRLTRKLMPIL